MKTLDQMAAQGQAKLQRKAAAMAAAYNGAKNRMKEHFGLTPFSGTMKTNYNAGVDDAVYHAPDPTKWRDNWIAKVSGR